MCLFGSETKTFICVCRTKTSSINFINKHSYLYLFTKCPTSFVISSFTGTFIHSTSIVKLERKKVQKIILVYQIKAC